MNKLSVLAVISVTVIGPSISFAKDEGKLPKGAVELSEQEVKDLYVGNSVKYDVGDGLVYLSLIHI